mmetsp:Transcript_16103/g.22237  ORF Transcript_16103/g.22237 Transcript_16103/m.22237 type:complete len:242 (-) Transcript_16103:100-825(-)|eukprot:CAMPEP_0196570438 /NCGR_PEP_ID=MMETSP1081-20130531/530_1 /TAXON_ID=36882 /ORGANISM="Pyramimonas amylifera, Strain CCMP720" /LENGTH=241 /DNA_ID=CAMNT_0041886885 /DNA_START=422 /DNA_END=1147 /DNA_ORIENTATION=-
MILLLNKAYRTLSQKNNRAAYDSWRDLFGRGERNYLEFTGQPLSRTAHPAATEALFVDETQCIGCRACLHEAPGTFIIDEMHGRARVATQWADPTEALHIAMDVCPVNCIHVVPAAELALLEWIHRSQPRSQFVNNQEMTKSGAKGLEECPFAASERFKERWREVEENLQTTRSKDNQKEKATWTAVKSQTTKNNAVQWWSFNRSSKSSSDKPVESKAPSCPLYKSRGPHDSPLLLPEASF